MACKITTVVATALAMGVLAACGGGGSVTLGGSAPTGGAPADGAPPAARKTFPVSVSLFVPKGKPSSASAVRASEPLYLPTSVNSVSIQQTESAGSVVTGAPVTVIVIGGFSCVASTGGQTCTVTLQGALGQDAWAIRSHVTGNGSGTALSLNTGTLTVMQGVANVLSLTLNPILATMAFSPVADSASATATTTLPLVLLAKDTAGATIIGPGTYVNASNVATPIALTSSSASHVVLEISSGTAATVTITTTASNNLAEIGYDGTLVAGSQSVTATATGITTANFALTLTLAAGGLVVPASIAVGEDLGTTTVALAISEPGYGGTFTLTSSSCAGIVSFPSVSGAGPSTSPTITQVGGGTCTILVSDGTNSSSVIVKSTTLGIVLN